MAELGSFGQHRGDLRMKSVCQDVSSRDFNFPSLRKSACLWPGASAEKPLPEGRQLSQQWTRCPGNATIPCGFATFIGSERNRTVSPACEISLNLGAYQ